MPAWTRKAATARTHRRLKALKRNVDDAIVAMAGDWSDADQFICTTLDDIKRTVTVMADQLGEDMTEALAEDTLARSIT